MKRIHIFYIGAKHALKLCKIQLGLKLLDFGESCFLRMTGWEKEPDKGKWRRPNKCNGFTYCMTHNATSITFTEIPQRIGIIQRECKIEQMRALAKGVTPTNDQL